MGILFIEWMLPLLIPFETNIHRYFSMKSYKTGDIHCLSSFTCCSTRKIFSLLMQVSFKTKLEDDKKLESSAKFSAKALFQNRDKTGMSDVADTVLNTTHQNQVQ